MRRAGLLILFVAARAAARAEEPPPPPPSFVQVAAGGRHTCALDSDGIAWCAGRNDAWQLGTSDGMRTGNGRGANDPLRFIGMLTPVTRRLHFRALTAGAAHTCGLGLDGRAWCWGSDGAHQLGATGARDTAQATGPNGKRQSWPASRAPLVVAQGRIRFEMLSAGANHTCGVARDGGLWCWGGNEDQQLGAPTTVACFAGKPCSSAPLAVGAGKKWRSVVAGEAHTCAIASDGGTYCWGSDGRGERLGAPKNARRESCGDHACSSVPQPVEGEPKLVQLALGRAHSCALTAEGRALCWGAGFAGALGIGTDESIATPTGVLGDRRFSRIAAGRDHTCATTTAGLLFCWGMNGDGQVGVTRGASGANDRRLSPTAVGGAALEGLSLGADHSCGVRSGMVYCWGADDSSQLGDNRLGSATCGLSAQEHYPCTSSPVRARFTR
jgi:alpha-tubulin suppressor-like RCC1 family protein